METTNHDNTNVRISNSFNGQVVLFSGVYVGGLGSIVLLIFALNFWAQTVALVGVLVYGIIAAVGLVVAIGIAYLWIRFVVMPWRRSKVLHTDPAYTIFLNALGNVEMAPVKPTIVEADATQEMHIVALAREGISQKMIADGMHISQPTVSRIINKHKKETA